MAIEYDPQSDSQRIDEIISTLRRARIYDGLPHIDRRDVPSLLSKLVDTLESQEVELEETEEKIDLLAEELERAISNKVEDLTRDSFKAAVDDFIESVIDTIIDTIEDDIGKTIRKTRNDKGM